MKEWAKESADVILREPADGCNIERAHDLRLGQRNWLLAEPGRSTHLDASVLDS
jgi:hypothetical protein